MKIDIVIPSNSPGHKLTPLLDSIDNSWKAVGKVIIVFNPAQPTEGMTLQKYRFPIQVIQNSGIGVNRARNAGLRAAESEVILFLDSDCRIFDSRFLNRHLQAHSNSMISAFGGPYKSSKGQSIFSETYSLLQRLWFLSGQSLDNQNRRLLGGNTSYKRDVLLSHPFDESIVFGAAETELNYRLAQCGHNLHGDPQCEIEHASDLSFVSFIGKAWAQGKNSGRFRLNTCSDPEGLITPELLEVESRLEGNTRNLMPAVLYRLVFEIAYCTGSGKSAPVYLLKKFLWKAYRCLIQLDAALEYRWKRALRRQ